MIKLDEKNCLILNLLQKNCRMSLTEISKNVNLSVDSVRKRLKKLTEQGIFAPKIQLRPKTFGFKNIIDVKIKIKNHDEKKLQEFIDCLIKNPRVAEIFAVSGEWDFTLVILAKDAADLGHVTKSIRNKFNKIISNWAESLTTQAYKFEDYDMLKLLHPNVKVK